MPTQIDPYTGQLIFTPPEQRTTTGGPLTTIMQALVAKGQEHKARIQKERATELVEETRQNVLGEPSPYLAMRQKVLQEEAQAREEQGILGILSEAVTTPFRALAPSNLGESMAGAPVRRETPIMDTDEAMAELGLVLQPGSPEYDVFAAQITAIKNEAILQKMAPVLEERYGIPPESVSIEGIKYLLAVEQELGPDMQIRERTVPGPNGEPMKQVFWENQRNGSMIPITEPARVARSQAGTLITYDEEGRPVVLQGSEALIAKGLAKGEAEDRVTLLRQKDQLSMLATGLDRINDLVQTGKEPTGALGRLAGSSRALAIEATRGLRIAGFPTTAAYLEEYDSHAIAATARKNAQLRVLQLSIAASLARALDPEGRDLSSREVDRALEATAPIFGGDPLASEAASRELLGVLTNNYNVKAQRLEEELFDAETAAPGLYRLQGAGRVVPADEVDRLRQRGYGFTLSERTRIRNAADPKAERKRILQEKGVYSGQ